MYLRKRKTIIKKDNKKPVAQVKENPIKLTLDFVLEHYDFSDVPEGYSVNETLTKNLLTLE